MIRIIRHLFGPGCPKLGGKVKLADRTDFGSAYRTSITSGIIKTNRWVSKLLFRSLNATHFLAHSMQETTCPQDTNDASIVLSMQILQQITSAICLFTSAWIRSTHESAPSINSCWENGVAGPAGDIPFLCKYLRAWSCTSRHVFWMSKTYFFPNSVSSLKMDKKVPCTKTINRFSMNYSVRGVINLPCLP